MNDALQDPELCRHIAWKSQMGSDLMECKSCGLEVEWEKNWRENGRPVSAREGHSNEQGERS